MTRENRPTSELTSDVTNARSAKAKVTYFKVKVITFKARTEAMATAIKPEVTGVKKVCWNSEPRLQVPGIHAMNEVAAL